MILYTSDPYSRSDKRYYIARAILNRVRRSPTGGNYYCDNGVRLAVERSRATYPNISHGPPYIPLRDVIRNYRTQLSRRLKKNGIRILVFEGKYKPKTTPAMLEKQMDYLLLKKRTASSLSASIKRSRS